ncbi:Ankyrin repeat and BTB/POZ domain-containing protein 1 [Pleodorina starrii]|uniref:Ankyrin repeat and BTB/POZ domain-containing protein 1 n=1 Tax=Pleodorina starrii TaxID=330485 RepID=A0A9W6F1L8_9CHLO|nr:Ankyrin repeat and BTB/POZ domain-containing protein 1 [Pleodorina starrii]
MLALLEAAYSVVNRPLGNSSGSQTLILLDGEIRELLEVSDGNSASGVKKFRLSEHRRPVAGTYDCGTAAVYEPTSDSIFFVDSRGLSIKRLDRDNNISLVAGSEARAGSVDGRGGKALFKHISSLAADGKGNVFVADGCGRESCIRVLRVRTGEVVTLRGSEPSRVESYWRALSYDAAAGVLVAATATVVCHVLVYGSENSSLGLCAAMRLVAGSWERETVDEGSVEKARFVDIATILAGRDSRVLVLDMISEKTAVHMMEADGTVRRVATFDFFCGNTHNMAVLAGGELALCVKWATNGIDRGKYSVAIISGDSSFVPSSEALAGLRPLAPPADVSARTALPDLLAVPTSGGGEGSEGDSGSSGARSPLVTVRVAGGKAFVAHRSVLAARSEYFKTQLAEGGGFGDSGAAEVTLEGAHPEAFGHLLSYSYTGLLDVPDELLRPAAELAGRLLLPADCIAQLTVQLLAAATPETVIGDLVWAVQHGMTELVQRLKAYLLRHRKAMVVAGPQVQVGLCALAALDPVLAGDIMARLL